MAAIVIIVAGVVRWVAGVVVVCFVLVVRVVVVFVMQAVCYGRGR